MDKKLNILFLCGWYPSRVLQNNGDFIQRHAKAVSLLHTVEVIHIISDKNCTKNIEITIHEIDGITTHIGYIKQTKNPILKCILFWKTYLILLKKTKNNKKLLLISLIPSVSSSISYFGILPLPTLLIFSFIRPQTFF